VLQFVQRIVNINRKIKIRSQVQRIQQQVIKDCTLQLQCTNLT